MQVRAWTFGWLRLPRLPFRPLSLVLGIFLLTTAALKAHGLTIDPLAQDSFLSSPRLLVATIEIEIIVGLWLLSGWWPRVAWLITLTFFAVLAGVSLYLALARQTSCGCFGEIPVNPWLTFALDLTIIGALLLARPMDSLELPSLASLPALLKIGGGSAGLLALFSGFFLVAFDNPIKALARLRGEPIAVVPSISQLGDGIHGEIRSFSVQLTNYTEGPICIIGGTANCSCIATDDLPLCVGAGETRSLNVRLVFRGSPGRFVHHFILYTDSREQPVVIARITGRVSEASSQ